MSDLKLYSEKRQTRLTPCKTGRTALILLSAILSFPAAADYIPYIENPSDGYFVRYSGQTTLAETPVISDGSLKYYKIGSSLTLNSGSPNLTVTGRSICLGKVFFNTTNVPAANAYHRFSTINSAFDIIGNEAIFKVTNNLYAGIPYDLSTHWKKASESLCAGTSNSPPSSISVPASGFNRVFPLQISFYLKNKIIDNQIHVPQTDIGGYILYFSTNGNAPRGQGATDLVPINQTTVPLRLAPFTITIPSSCKVTTSSGIDSQLNISHGRLNSMNYDSEAQGNITYTCQFASQTKVNLKLDYISDTDPQKRLPLTSTTDNQKKIYSELTMVDDNTGQSGKAFSVTFKERQSITIKSHLKGTNAEGGHYQGSAWVIATFD